MYEWAAPSFAGEESHDDADLRERARRIAPGRQPRSARLAHTLYRKAVGGGALDAESLGASLAAALRQPGEALPDELRRRLEAELGADLRDVRVLRDAHAAAVVRSVAARAVTYGRLMLFDPAAWEPHSRAGQELIAHEAHHAASQPEAAPRVSAPTDAAERAADAFAAHFVAQGVAVDDRQLGLLARHYGEGVAMSRWALGTDGATGAAHLARMLHHCEGHRAHGEGDDEAAPTPLEPTIRAAIEATTGVVLGDVRIARDAALRARGRVGETVGNLIRLSPDVPGADDAEGRKVRLHEAAHVAQQRVEGSASAAGDGGVEHVEADAHRIADAAERGDRAAPTARAQPTAAYGIGVTDVTSALGLDPIGYLRAHFPALAPLLSGDFDPIMRQVGDAVSGAVRPLLAGTGVERMAAGLAGFFSQLGGGDLAFGTLTGCCECLQGALDGALRAVQRGLQSPIAQQLQSWMQQWQQSQTSQLVDMLSDFFTVLRVVGGPIVAIIDLLGGLLEQAKAALSALGEQVWQTIAPRLGLDPSLPPREAIKKKLSELWAQAMSALAPVRAAIQALWTRIQANPIVAKIIKFVSDCQKLYRAIQLCRQAQSRDPKVWLAILARELRGTMFEGLLTSLQDGYKTVLDLKRAATDWVLELLQSLGILDAWNAGVPWLQALGGAIRGFVDGIRNAITELRAAVAAALDELGTALKELYDAVKPLLDFVLGFGVAMGFLMTGNFVPMMMFLAGQLWLRALPDCYKLAIANFVLDVFISVVEWVPAEFPMVTVVRGAILGFLRAVRGASTEQKIGAMNMVARLISGDLEFAAGLMVGIFEGLRASTLGMIIELALSPFTSMISTVVSAGRACLDLSARTFHDVLEGAGWLAELLQSTHEVHAPSQQPAAGPGAAPGGTPDGAEPASPTGAVTETVETEPAEVLAPAPQEDEPAGDPPPPGGDSVGAVGDAAAPETGASTSPGEAEGEADTDAAPAEPNFDPPPPLPSFPEVHAIIDRVFRQGVSRADIERFLGRFNLQMDALGQQVGGEAGVALMNAMNARSAPYDIGRFVGKVVGWAAGEIIMLVATDGIANAVGKAFQGGELLLTIGRNFPRAIRMLEELRVALRPLLEFFGRIADELVAIGRRIMAYLDELVIWARAQLAKLMVWAERNLPRLLRGARRVARRLMGDDTNEELEELAERAAERGWHHLRSFLGDDLRSLGTLGAELNGLSVPHPIDTRVSARVQSRGSHWWVKATASKGTHRQHASDGRGWVTTEWGTGVPFYAGHEDWLLHRDILDDAEDQLRAWRPNATGVPGGYAELEQRTQEIVARQGRRLRLHGVQFRFELESLASVERTHDTTITLIITPNSRVKRVMLPGPYATSYLGATRVGTTNSFTGSYGDAAWTWTSYAQSCTRHPVNAWSTGGYVHDVATVPQPGGTYTYGGGTNGWDASTWRTELRRKVRAKQAATPGLTEADAQERVRADFVAAGYAGMTSWSVVSLEGWQGHHIHEVSWGGPHSVGNIIYLSHGDHHPMSTWWNNRRNDIKDNLGIPR